MKFLQLLFMVVLLLFTFVGCGSKGGGDYNGNLSIKTSQSDNGNGTANLSFTIQYSKDGVSNYAGLYCSVNDGSSDSFTFSSSGIKTLTAYNVLDGQTVSLKAQVGDIVSSAAITAKANSTFSVTPSTYDFGIGGTGTSTTDFVISGGTTAYTESSSTTDISINPVSDTAFTLTVVTPNTTATAKTATITITDSSSPAKSATLTVTY